MEEAYSGESRRGGALEKAVHGEGLRRRRELRGGLEGESQKLGSGAKRVRGWMEELEAWWIGVWLSGSHEFGWKAESIGAARFCALGANEEGRRGYGAVAWFKGGRGGCCACASTQWSARPRIGEEGRWLSDGDGVCSSALLPVGCGDER